MLSVDASTTRTGKKYRWLEYGQKYSTPRLAVVSMSSRPCEAQDKNTNASVAAREARNRDAHRDARNATTAANTSEWVNPRWPKSLP